MRRTVASRLVAVATIASLAACTSGPEATIEPVDDAIDSATVVGGDVLGSGDASDDSSTASTSEPDRDPDPDLTDDTGITTADDTTTDDGTDDATGGDGDAATTRPASTTTSSPGADDDATTDDDGATGTTTASTERPIGDGPVLTNPDGDDAFGESPGVQTGLVPVFFALEATPQDDCAGGDQGSVVLRWEVIGAETVDISIGTVGAITNPGERPAGELRLPHDCATGTQYFVIAENPDGEAIRSVSVGPG